MLHKTLKKWVKHWNTNTKNIIADINNIIVSDYGPGTGPSTTDTVNTIPPYLEPEQYPAPAAEVTPQAFRDQKTAMVGQPVLRGRQSEISSTMRTAGRKPARLRNRRFGSGTTILTGSTV